MTLKKIFSTKKVLLNVLKYQQPLVRQISVSLHKCEKANVSMNENKVDWSRAVDDAIKVVGYQTPYLTLGLLTKEKDVKWMDWMEKLEETDHPLRNVSR
jgi:hypothetical protein